MWWCGLAACAWWGPSDMDRVETWRDGDPLPPVQVVDEHGASMRLDALRGRPALVGFVFTRCGNDRACPMTMRRLVSVQEAVPADDLTLVVFTIDPRFDRPERLRVYARSYGADLDRWVLATGEEELLREGLPSLFNVYALGEGPSTSHPVKLTLLDADGVMVADWDDDEELIGPLKAELQRLRSP